MSENRISSAWDGGGQELVRTRDECTRRAAQSYKAGVEAMEKQDWGLAGDMFAEAAKSSPDKLNFRQLLRNCTCKRYKDNKTGASSLTRMKLTGIRERVRTALADWNWRLADLLCEEGLAIDPWDVELNVALAEAARARGFLEIAKFSLCFALALAPRSREILVKLIQVLRELGAHDQADEVRRRLDRLEDEGNGE
jgi:hypothetical protein